MLAGSIIKLLRTADGKSQTDFARELGVTRTYLSQVENDRKQPSLAFLRTVSEQLRVPLVLLVADHEAGAEPDAVLGELRRILGELLAARLAGRGGDRNEGQDETEA